MRCVTRREDRHEREEEQQQRCLEDPRHREERGVGGPCDRRVVLVEDDDARPARDGDGRERPQHLQRLARVRDRRHVAADRAASRLADVGGAAAAGAGEPMVGAVCDCAAGRQQRRSDEALVEDVRLEEAVEYRSALGRQARFEVCAGERVSQHGAREHAHLGGGRALGLDGVVVADDHEDRCRRQRERDPGRDGEAEDEPRRCALRG